MPPSAAHANTSKATPHVAFLAHPVIWLQSGSSVVFRAKRTFSEPLSTRPRPIPTPRATRGIGACSGYFSGSRKRCAARI